MQWVDVQYVNVAFPGHTHLSTEKSPRHKHEQVCVWVGGGGGLCVCGGALGSDFIY